MACAEHAAATYSSFAENVVLALALLPARSPVLPTETQLFQLTLQLLALRAEDHSLVLVDDQLQMFNLPASLFHLLAGQLLLFEQLVLLRDHHLLQCFGIERIEIR